MDVTGVLGEPDLEVERARLALADNADLNLLVEPAAPAPSGDGPLAGVPVLVKDCFYDRDRTPTMGSNVHAPERGGTAAILERLRAAGAIVIGYANLHEWAIGMTSAFTATGPVLNPLDRERVAGGSSGGSAASVAAGIVPLAIGTDAGGSIRCPAACCRVVGFKPSFGAVPYAGAVGEDSELSVAGPLARDVATARRAFEVLAGIEMPGVDVERLRVAVAYPFFCDDVDPAIQASLEAAAEALRATVAGVGWIEIESAQEAARVVSVVHLSHTASILGGTVEERAEEFHPKTLDWLRRGLATTREDLADVSARTARVRAGWERAFESVDVVLSPTLPAGPATIRARTVELPSGTHSAEAVYLGHNAPMNVAGLPGLSLPVPSAKGGAFNVTLSGRPGEDHVVLALGEALQGALNRTAGSPGV